MKYRVTLAPGVVLETYGQNVKPYTRSGYKFYHDREYLLDSVTDKMREDKNLVIVELGEQDAPVLGGEPKEEKTVGIPEDPQVEKGAAETSPPPPPKEKAVLVTPPTQLYPPKAPRKGVIKK